MNLHENISRIKEVMGIVNEAREGFFNYVKEKAKEISGIEWPDYVLKDWLYRNTKDIKNETPEEYKNLVKIYVENFIQTYGKGHWEHKVLDISIDSFTDSTKRDLEKKVGGFINSDIGKDQERHSFQQSQLEKVGVSSEPIIVVKTKDGKYDLLEGWHRTTSSLKKYGEYKQNAWVYVADSKKSEELEGVGAYAAPAFEMKPDHVHFKHLYNESKITDFLDKIRDTFSSDFSINQREEKKRIDAFQKISDIIYKFTIKNAPMDGVGGLHVGTVWKSKWGANYMKDDDLGRRWDFFVRLYPIFTTDEVNQGKFEEQYKVFQEKFKNNAKMMGLSSTSPIEHKDVHDYKVDFDFLEISFRQPLPRVGMKL